MKSGKSPEARPDVSASVESSFETVCNSKVIPVFLFSLATSLFIFGEASLSLWKTKPFNFLSAIHVSGFLWHLLFSLLHLVIYLLPHADVSIITAIRMSIDFLNMYILLNIMKYPVFYRQIY